MFDIGWTEMLVVACVAILVVGPKDLPRMLRTFGKAMGNIRRMAGDFQRQFNDAIRESELDEVRSAVTKSETFQPLADAKQSMEDFQKTMNDSIEANKKPQKPQPKPAEDSKSAAAKKASGQPAKTSAKKTPAKKPTARKSPTNSTATRKSAAAKPAKKPAARKPRTTAGKAKATAKQGEA